MLVEVHAKSLVGRWYACVLLKKGLFTTYALSWPQAQAIEATDNDQHQAEMAEHGVGMLRAILQPSPTILQPVGKKDPIRVARESTRQTERDPPKRPQEIKVELPTLWDGMRLASRK